MYIFICISIACFVPPVGFWRLRFYTLISYEGTCISFSLKACVGTSVLGYGTIKHWSKPFIFCLYFFFLWGSHHSFHGNLGQSPTPWYGLFTYHLIKCRGGSVYRVNLDCEGIKKVKSTTFLQESTLEWLICILIRGFADTEVQQRLHYDVCKCMNCH